MEQSLIFFFLQKKKLYIFSAKFMEDLNNMVEKLFNDIRIIIVDDKNGYIILPDITRIKFYRITRGNPRFQVLF